jgi:integrase
MSDCTSGTTRLSAEVQRCRSELSATAAEATGPRIASTWLRFETFAVGGMAKSLADVTPALVDSFVRSRTDEGTAASTSTMHNRRTSLRVLFRTARRLGLTDGDPTLDIVLPPRIVGSYRPLTDEEIELCRDAAAWWMSSQRFAAVWALAEATARGAELGSVRASDVDLDQNRVWLSGGTRIDPRWAPLNNWARAALERRLNVIDGDEFVGYRGTSPRSSGRISAASAVGSVLTRAGFGEEPDLRPMSVAAWAGRVEFDRTGSIAAAARLLGLRSLDATTRMIGWDWAS